MQYKHNEGAVNGHHIQYASHKNLHDWNSSGNHVRISIHAI